MFHPIDWGGRRIKYIHEHTLVAPSFMGAWAPNHTCDGPTPYSCGVDSDRGPNACLPKVARSVEGWGVRGAPPARLHSAPSGPEGAEWGCGVRSGNGGVRTGGVGCTIGTTTTHQHINLPSGEGSCNKKAGAPVIFVESILTFPIGVEGV